MNSSGRIYWVIVLLLAGTLGASLVAGHRSPDFLSQPLDTINTHLAGWTSVADQTFGARVLGELRPSSYLSRIYQKQDRQLGLFIAFYAQQRAGESMHSPKHCLPGSGWSIWRYGSVAVPVGPASVRINNYSIQNSGRRAVVLYWYQSQQRVIASEYLGKILLVRDALVDGRTAGSIVRLTLEDEPGAVKEGVQFASRLIPEVQRCFGK